jgi:hypothetical protein
MEGISQLDAPAALPPGEGRTLAQAISLWLSIAAARVHVRAERVGFVMDKASLEQVSSERFGFPF